MKEIKIQIAPKFIFSTVLVLFGFYFAYLIRDVLIMIFIAFILNSGLRPLVNRLERYRIPRSLSIIFIYLGFIALLVGMIALISGQFIDQFVQLINSLPDYVEQILSLIKENVPGAKDYLDSNDINTIVNDISKSVAGVDSISDIDTPQIARFLIESADVISKSGISIIGSIAGAFLSVFTVIMVSIYMLQKQKDIYGFVEQLFPKKQAEKISQVIKKIEIGLGEWLIGQVTLMFIIGLTTYIIIMIPRVFMPGLEYELYQFALVIALMAGIFNIIPQLGPFLTLIITFILTIGTGAGLGIVIYILIMFLLLQQLEGIIITPMVMKKTVGVDPVITIVAIIAGLNLGGPLLAILSIPIFVSFKIILYEVAGNWKEEMDAKDMIKKEKETVVLKAKSFAEKIQELARQKK